MKLGWVSLVDGGYWILPVRSDYYVTYSSLSTNFRAVCLTIL